LDTFIQYPIAGGELVQLLGHGRFQAAGTGIAEWSLPRVGALALELEIDPLHTKCPAALAGLEQRHESRVQIFKEVAETHGDVRGDAADAGRAVEPCS
jgi:hypothetical protein